ncbi:Ig-like domain-containing protein, partial [Grimontia indica]|uniref:Ig-like domain-containing protein n=1 Tax=Grimontia indica TaxID=1056512 RepID=UPI00126980E3
TVTDVAGNVSEASTPAGFTLDTTAAGEGTGVGGTDEAPVLTIAEATDGVSEAEASDGVQVSVAVPTGAVSGDTITLTVTQPDGTSETVDTLIPSDWNGTDPIVMTVSTDILSDTDGFVDGDYSVTATVTDVAGNVSEASTPAGFTLDTTAAGEGTGAGGTDEAPVLTIAEATDGVSEAEASDGVQVSVAVPTGTLAGDTITLTVTQPDGTTESVDTLIPSDWNGTDTIVMTVSTDILSDTDGFVDGDYSVTATVTDVAGNVSQSSNTSSFTLDTTAPTAATIDALVTNDITPVVTGTATLGDGESLSVTLNGVTYEDVPVDADGNWNIEVADAESLAEGTYDVTAVVYDTAGNTTSDVTVNELTVDLTAPESPIVSIVDDTNDDGLANTAEQGNDNLQLSVAVDHDELSAGGIVTLSIDNNGTSNTVNLLLDNGTLQFADGSDATGYTYTNGVISWTETVSAGGSVSVAATQTDAAGNVSSSASDSATVTQALADSASAQEDTNLNGNVLINDLGNTSVVSFTVTGVSTTFTAGQTATITGIGTFILNADGGYTFTPVADWSGSVPQVTYTTNSGDSATLTMTVTAVDDAVDAVSDSYSTDKDSSISLNLLGNDSAPDGGLSITHINGVQVTGGSQSIAVDNGNVVIASDGSMSFQPVAGYIGDVSFNYQVKDADGDTDTASVDISVVNPNAAPDAIDDSTTMVDAGAITTGYTGPTVDTTILEGFGTNRVDDSAYISTTNADGSYTVVWRAWDTNYYGNNKVALQTFNADGTPKGDKVILGGRDKIESPQVTQLNDSGDMLVTWTGYNNNATLNTHSYAQVVYANPDDHGGATTGPIMDLGSSQLRTVTSEHSGDTSVIVWQNNFTLYKQVLDTSGNKIGSPTVVGSVSANSNGYPIEAKVEITTLDNGNYVISWNQGSTATATNTVMLSPDGDKIGSTQTLNIGGTDGVGDLETNVISVGDGKYAIVGSSGGVVKLTLLDESTNLPITNSTQTLSLAGTSGNSLPSIANVGTDGDFVVVWRGIEGGQWQTYIQHFDANGSKDQAVSKLETPGGHGPAKVIGVGSNGDYVIVWSGINDAGNYDVHTQKYNADGTKDGEQLTFTGQQEDKNDLNFDIVAVGDDGAYTISYLGTDSSANGGDYSIYIASVDANGNKVVAYPEGSTGDFTIGTDVTVTSGFYTVTYSTGTLYANGVIYPSGSQVPATEWVDVKLVGATASEYDLVVTAHESISTSEDTSLVLNATDLLVNDTDADGDTLTIVSVQDPQNGSVILNPDGTITFTPTSNYNGPASFTYTISDGQGKSDTATVYLTVKPEDDAVDAINDEFTLGTDNSVALDLLSNDLAPDGGLEVTQINGVTLTGGAQTIAVDNGNVVIASDGSMSFVSNTEYYGEISFNYQVTDADGDIDSANVTINGNASIPEVSSITHLQNGIENGWVGWTLNLTNISTSESTVTVGFDDSTHQAEFGSDYAGIIQVWNDDDSWTQYELNESNGWKVDITVPSGDDSVRIFARSIDDNVYEGNETIKILGAVTSQQEWVESETALIIDTADIPKVTSVTADSVAEGGTNTFTVGLSNTSTTATTVNMTLASGNATKGTDFSGSSVSVVINGTTQTVSVASDGTFNVSVPAGQNSFEVKVATINDDVFEGNERYTLTAAANGTSKAATASITDVEDAPVPESITVDTAPEGGTHTFDVNLSNASTTDRPVVLQLFGDSATHNSDFDGTSITVIINGQSQTIPVSESNNFTVTVPAGETNFKVQIATLNDNVFDGNEEYTLTVRTGGVTLNSTATITDDADIPKVTSVSSTSVNEGEAASVTITLSNESTTPTRVFIDAYGGSATEGSDFNTKDLWVNYG